MDSALSQAIKQFSLGATIELTGHQPFLLVISSTKSFPQERINGKDHPATKGHVLIENDVWIGAGCTIMSGVRVGSGSVVAAKSVVIKDVDPYTIVGGNPAKQIKQRFPQHIIKRLTGDKVVGKRRHAQINKIVPLLQSPLTEE